MEPLLLVEDKPELRAMLKKALERAGHTVDEAPDGSSAVAKVRARRYVLVLTDLKLPGCSGLEVLRETKQADPTIPVILITAYGSVEEAVTAMKEGAYDFIQKPVDLDHLNLLVERASQQQELLRENLLLREEYAERYGFPRIVGEHKSMQEATHQVQRVAATDSTVLLLGQSGTGKELFARAIHHLSPRRQHAFVALNCAAIPEGLVENELFGHERGAYTGAGSRKVGKMELANRGTIFLDEIAELPLSTQAKLLRVLEERSFERVGGTQLVDIDVRILAATNKDLREAVASKTFREDLYFRIAAVPITIPGPQRARRRCRPAGRPFPGALPARISQAEFEVCRKRPHRFARLFVARQRSRTSEHHRARRHPDGLRDHRSGRPATPRAASSRWRYARGNVGGSF